MQKPNININIEILLIKIKWHNRVCKKNIILAYVFSTWITILRTLSKKEAIFSYIYNNKVFFQRSINAF